MTIAMIIATALAAATGFGVFVWSLFRTRRLHYEDYLERKKNR